MGEDKVKVAVRVRPLNSRELNLSAKCVVEMKNDQTVLHDPRYSMSSSAAADKKHQKNFAFDHCFWSCRQEDAHFADQDDVYEAVGRGVLENAFQGYNACIFAYGQTGSGKSYTMMGTTEQPGVIPTLCRDLFFRIESDSASNATFKVEVSFMEIYNEKVYDLLNPSGVKQSLRVREHNILGPYVDGLTNAAVESFEDIDGLMAEGNKARTVAATNMNSESSRSHAVFTIVLTQVMEDVENGVRGEKVSRISLVDLAGSERANKTGAEGERLKEGSNINKSLSTLGLVISSLAEQSSRQGKGKNVFVPYRDSVLTWLLKDNLGGNSRTVMIATISAAADEYEETLSTLRYADRTKRIVNHAVVNEDPNAKIIRELREEVEMLRKQLLLTKGKDIEERYAESKMILEKMNKPWEEKLKESGQLHEARQQALEQMGISVHSSGIKVEQGRHYLVNLNDDPSLNENLVYYLKEYNSVGRPEAPEQQDVQLSGIGIRPEHATLVIEGTELYVFPIEDAKTCVNGAEICDKTRLYNRDRLVFGNNHFFRVNCPKTENSGSTPEEPVNYESAREELIRNKMNDPATASLIYALESQYHEDKQRALVAQSQKYEQQMQLYKSTYSVANTPATPNVNNMAFGSSYDLHRSSYTPSSLNAFTPTYPNSAPRYEVWNHEREEWFNKCLGQLKTELIKANSLAQEARYLAKELAKDTDYQVTLQIPVSNLTPNRKIYSSLSEAAIVVKRKHLPNQIWSIEKLQNKLIDMRELYTLWKGPEIPTDDQLLTALNVDPFYEHEENHNLIGVANVYMSALFHDVALDYNVPIVSQQGEIVGRLHVEIARVRGNLSMEDREGDAGVDNGDSSDYDEDGWRSNYSETSEESHEDERTDVVVCRISIREATGLPPAFSNFVFCQYTFWGERDAVVVPHQNLRNQTTKTKDGARFRFNFSKDHAAVLTEDFFEFCQDGSLSIQVWGHKHSGIDAEWDVTNKLDIKSKTIADHWSEVSRKLDMLVEIRELNDHGVYAAVDVNPDHKVQTGGFYQLRQGQQRHIHITVTPAPKGGFLPVNVSSIVSASIGSIAERDLLQQKGLDSYQEDDLKTLRSKWELALVKRQQHLSDELEKLGGKLVKSDADLEREKNLNDQFLTWTEEKSSVHVPSADSGIPGAPAQGPPPEGMEMHLPVLFMELQPDDIRTCTPLNDQYLVIGAYTDLPRENAKTMLELPLIRADTSKAAATFSWDSSRHDSQALNCVSAPNRYVYMIVKAVVRLTHPAPLDLVLRKRICISIVKKRGSMLLSMFQKFSGRMKMLQSTGVTYQIVSSLPKASEESEDRTQLALLAAASDSVDGKIDGESYIDLYLRNVLSVEMLLKKERDRQEIKIKELLSRLGKPLRKTASVPTGIGHFSRSNEILSSIRDMRPSIDSSFSDADMSLPISDSKERKAFKAPTSPHELYTPTPSKFTSRMLPVEEEQNTDGFAEKEAVSLMQKSIPETLFDSDHSLHSHVSLDVEGSSGSTHGSPSVKQSMQNSSSLSGISSGVGSQTNTQSSLSDDGSSFRSSNVSPDIDSGYREPVDNERKLNHVDEKLIIDDEEHADISVPEEKGHETLPSVDPVNGTELENIASDNAVVPEPESQNGIAQMDKENTSNRNSLAESDVVDFQSNEAVEGSYDWITVGTRVMLLRNNSPGVVKFVGVTEFGDGTWVGIALDEPDGKHDGTAYGRRYFTCTQGHGLYARPSQLIPFGKKSMLSNQNTKPVPTPPQVPTQPQRGANRTPSKQPQNPVPKAQNPTKTASVITPRSATSGQTASTARTTTASSRRRKNKNAN